MKRLLLSALCLLIFTAQQSRISSDFEIAEMERQLTSSKSFVAQLSARLNLGDLRLARNEAALATAEYTKALDVAARERLEARRDSDMTRYATATSYAALAEAKLSHDARAFALAEEALRYTSDSAKTWNLYANTMSLLHKTAKAASAARIAVAIAEADVQKSPSTANRLDLAIYQYSLATFTDDEQLLRGVVASLQSSAFDPLKSAVVRNESFEIYSTARGEEAAYVSLLNRAQLRLAALYERRGDVADARATYESVLKSRSDDPTALAAMARLAGDRYYAAAFDANPFSLPLIRDYERYLDRAHPPAPDETSTGAEVRRALQQLHAGESRAARATLDALLARFPDNDTLRQLRREAEEHATQTPAFLTSGKATAQPTGAELRQLLGLKLTPEQRAALDRMTLAGTAAFKPETRNQKPDQTVFESGTIEGVPFRFAEPTIFTGDFAPNAPLRLTYRILGVTDVDGADGLLLEPIRLEPIR